MIIVSVVSETGAFAYAGYAAFRLAGGHAWFLVAALCTITALISALLDNVTTILLMTPVIIQLCEALRIDPTKVLYLRFSHTYRMQMCCIKGPLYRNP